ncbi:IPT/TIG domain-containing protein [Actinoplanes regularis]|uniref:IPT/TIG domain-containing protein n=1 Tax=Actinoplanes regularis TaxID=52697 RepID=A0A239DCL6_9ACTN|nr:IPT/TIG domain-containing protein [Actinoplanes regularis]GIE88754.1 hypothetical protein Are01nite_52340 [Actinoplanes regularis]SNS29802.1 IPT/TIG domain-containing protein [Actinoplanes regularis]
MSKTESSSIRRRILRGGIATAAATATVVAGVASPAAAAATLTLSSAYGPGGAGAAAVTITGSSTTAWLAGLSAPLQATLSVPVCPAKFATATTDSGTVTATTGYVVTGVTATRLTDNKAAIGLPAALPMASGATSQKYNICVYSSSTNDAPLQGNAVYTVGVPATLTSVTPASGLAVGGTTITVSGTNFPTTSTAITATLGGNPLTGVTAIGPGSFKATVPSGKPGAATLTVTTNAGSVSLPSAYTYSNGINIAPNTAPNTSAAVYVDVMGSGFSGLSFDSASGVGGAGRVIAPAADTKARVFLVNGVYDPTDNSGDYTNGPVAECGAVAVISDRELICGLNLATAAYTPATGVKIVAPTAVTNGTYTLTVASIGKIGPVLADDLTQTDLSSGSTFTVAPY